MTSTRILAAAGMFGFMLAVAGCQSGDGAGALSSAASGQQPVAEGQVRESELRAYCPRANLREGTSIFRSYQGKGEEDPAKLVYQASVSDITRSCTYGPGTITVNVAVAGKVVPGPQAQDGTITMPIRVAAILGTEVVYSQLHQFQITVNRAGGASQFVFNDPNVTLPTSDKGTIQIFAGFDEGPEKKKSSDE